MAKVKRYVSMPLVLLISTTLTAAITAPAGGTTLTDGTPVTVTVQVSSAAIGVSVKLDGATKGAATTSDGLNWSYTYTPITGDIGSRTLTAVATAPSGAQATTAGVAVTVASGTVNFATILSTGAQVCQTDLGLTYGATLRAGAGNTATSVVTLTGGPIGAYVPIQAKATNTANIGSGATFSVSFDGGSTFPITGLAPTAATPIALTGAGTGVSIAWSAGSSVGTNTWDATASGWADQSGNGKNYSQSTASLQPLIAVGTAGFVELQFDGVDDFLTSSFAPAAAGTTPISMFLVLRQITNVNNGCIIGDNGAFGVCGMVQGSGTTIKLFNSGAGASSSNLPLSTYGVITAFAAGSASDSIKAGAGDTTHTGSSGNNTGGGKTIGGGSGLNSAKIGLLAIGYQTGALSFDSSLRAAAVSKYGAIAA
jgi:hypothetical protein